MLQAFIASQPLDLPEDFNFPIERYSPQYDDSLRIGDLSMGIEFPATPQNRRAFAFSDEFHQAEKTLVYDHFRIEQDGQICATGILTMQKAHTAQTGGKFITNFTTNRIPDITSPLAEILTKSINLGANTEAIIASAKAQNAAAMSPDGINGAVMKFVPHQNTDLYDDDINADWRPKAEKYDIDKQYEAGSLVTWQEQNTLHDPTRYITRVGAGIGNSPGSVPEADIWSPWRNSIVNAWDSENSKFFTNGLAVHGDRYSVNYHALSPWLQIHDVVRHLAEVLGYTARGTYLDDAIEQRALMYSNYILSRFETYFLLLAMDDGNGANTVDIPANTPDGVQLPIVLSGADVDNDQHNLFDDQTLKIGLKRKGNYIVKIRGFADITDPNQEGPYNLNFALANDADTPVDTAIARFPYGSFDIGPIYFETALEYYYTYSGPDDSQTLNLRIFAGTPINTVASFTLTNIEIKLTNDTWHRLDQYSGKVDYANHVPDISAADFLMALATWKTLDITFDRKSRMLILDYKQAAIEAQPTLSLSSEITGTVATRTLPPKSWKLTYGNSPENSDIYKNGNADKYVTVDTPDDVIASIYSGSFSQNQSIAIFVRSINAWLTLKENGEGNAPIWKISAHDYPPLLIQQEGERTEISPDIGPVPMGFFRNVRNQRITGPVIAMRGRSDTQQREESRPPFLACYWLGIDTSVVAAGYPLATTTRYNAAGTALLPRDMRLTTLYSDHWKRIMQLMAREERITITAVLPPDLQDALSFDRPLLIDQVPALPIRTAHTITATGSSSAGPSSVVEMEARKVKMVDVKIVSDEAEPEPEVELWTPSQIETELWLDFADESTVTLEGGKISQVIDKSGNLNHAGQTDPAKRPDYATHPTSGLKCYSNDGTHKYLDLSMLVANQAYSFIFSAQVDTSNYSGIIFSRDGSNFGVALYAGATLSYRTYPYPPSSNIWVDGLSTTSTSYSTLHTIVSKTPTPPPAGTYNATVGKDPTYINRNIDGTINEIIIIKENISDELREKLEGYLAWKHNTHDLLPGAHPYKLSPPTL